MRRRRDLTAYHVPPDKEFGSGEESCTTNQVDAKNHDIFCKLGYCDYGHIRLSNLTYARSLCNTNNTKIVPIKQYTILTRYYAVMPNNESVKETTKRHLYFSLQHNRIEGTHNWGFQPLTSDHIRVKRINQ